MTSPNAEAVAAVAAAMDAASAAADDYQAQGQGVAMPGGDAHPLVPGNAGRLAT